MLDAMDSPRPVKFSKGEQILDFIHVDDIASFFYCLFIHIDVCTDNFTQFHLGTGNGHSIREVSHILENVFSKKINANWGGLPYREFDPMYAVAPIAKNIEIIKWKSKIELEKGLLILKDERNFF